MKSKVLKATLLLIIICFTSMNTFAQKTTNYLRIAQIVIKADKLDEYKLALKEGVKAALQKEPGVISMIAVYSIAEPTHVTVFENYASLDAYKSHIQTDHFKKYKATVADMVVALELVDVDTIIRGDKTKIE